MTMWPVLANQAAAGCLAGMYNGRQYVLNASGAPILPANQAGHSTCAQAFGQAFDAALLALYSADGGPPAGLIPIGGVIQSEEANLGVTQIFDGQVVTAAQTNVAFTYPPAVFGLCLAITAGRGLTKDNTGVVFTEADWVASGIPAVAAAQFYEYLKVGVVSTT